MALEDNQRNDFGRKSTLEECTQKKKHNICHAFAYSYELDRSQHFLGSREQSRLQKRPIFIINMHLKKSIPVVSGKSHTKAHT